MSEDNAALTVKKVTTVCPRGHRDTTDLAPFSIEIVGMPESRNVLCRICYVEWIAANCPAAVIEEEA